MTGKQKCAILKEIRRDIAKKNDISIRIDECTHKGKCRGTCPRCEAEVRILERELEAKKKRGLQTAIAGVSAGILAASLASCVPVAGEDPNPNDTTAGMPVIETETEEAAAIAGEIAPPDEQTDGDDDEYMLEGDVLAPDYTDDVLLEGEPPVDDYEYEEEEPDLDVPMGKIAVIDTEEDNEARPEEETDEEDVLPTAGLLAPDEYLADGACDAAGKEQTP